MNRQNLKRVSPYSREGRNRMCMVYREFAFLAKTDVREVLRLAKDLPFELRDKLDKVYIALDNIQELLSRDYWDV
jgi:hypothetical protein